MCLVNCYCVTGFDGCPVEACKLCTIVSTAILTSPVHAWACVLCMCEMHVVLPKLVMSISLCRDVQVFTFSDKV